MIRRLRIERYRSILRADIDLGRVNLFIGANGSGKSNILEALGFLSAVAGRGLEAGALAERGVRLSLGPMFKSAFKNRDLPSNAAVTVEFDGAPRLTYGMSFTAGAADEALKIRTEFLTHGRRPILGRGPRGTRVLGETVRADPARSLWDSHGQTLGLPRTVSDPLRLLERYAVYAPETAVMRGTANERVPREPLGLAGSGLAAAFQRVLLQRGNDGGAYEAVREIVFMSGWADQVSVGGHRPDVVPRGVAGGALHLYFRDRFMHGRRNELSTYDASEGTLYLLFVATLLAHPDTPRCFALDNADMALSPALATRLIQHVARQVVSTRRADPLAEQVLLTSHNPTALDGLDLFDDEQRLFVVYRGRLGETLVRRVQPPPGVTRDQWVVEKHGRRLSELLIAGQIEGALGPS